MNSHNGWYIITIYIYFIYIIKPTTHSYIDQVSSHSLLVSNNYNHRSATERQNINFVKYICDFNSIFKS